MAESKEKSTYLSAFSSERGVLTEEITKKLATVLNKLHEVNFSERFWKITLGTYVNSVISRRSFLSADMDLAPLFEPINARVHPGLKQRFTKRLRYLTKSFQTGSNYKPILKILSENKNIAFGFHDPQSITSDVGSYLPDFFPRLRKRNAVKRKEAVTFAQKETDVFYRNVIKQLPEIYVEYFDEIMQLIPIYDPSEKVFHTSILDSFFMKFLLAKYLDNGAKLHFYQHGGYYGEIASHNGHKNEAAISDRYITWGWKIYEKDTPGKAYRLEKFKREYQRKPKVSSYDCLFCYPGINSKNREEYKQYTDDLSVKLNRSKYSRLIARPRPSSKIPFIAHKIGFPVSKDITIDTAKTGIADVISQTRAVIQFTVPSTNFMECLYVDHPTVGLLNNDDPTEIIKPFYEFFLEVGVLHNNFDSLISHLNRIDLEQWWNEVLQHPTYSEFKNTFLKAVN